MKLDFLPATVDGDLHAIVEAARGARTKYKFDPGTSMFTLHKILPRGMTYPTNFGFIPSTRAEDGDPLDVLVLSEEPSPPGCLIRCRTLGVIEAVQVERGKRIRNDRIVGVPVQDREIRTIRDVSPTQLREIEEFFVAFNRILGKRFEILGHQGRSHANRIIRRSRVLRL